MIDRGRETSSLRRVSVEVRFKPGHDPDLAAPEQSSISVSRIPCASKNELSLKINITLFFLLMQLKRVIIEMFLTGQFFSYKSQSILYIAGDKQEILVLQ